MGFGRGGEPLWEWEPFEKAFEYFSVSFFFVVAGSLMRLNYNDKRQLHWFHLWQKWERHNNRMKIMHACQPANQIDYVSSVCIEWWKNEEKLEKVPHQRQSPVVGKEKSNWVICGWLSRTGSVLVWVCDYFVFVSSSFLFFLRHGIWNSNEVLDSDKEDEKKNNNKSQEDASKK